MNTSILHLINFIMIIALHTKTYSSEQTLDNILTQLQQDKTIYLEKFLESCAKYEQTVFVENEKVTLTSAHINSKSDFESIKYAHQFYEQHMNTTFTILRKIQEIEQHETILTNIKLKQD